MKAMAEVLRLLQCSYNIRGTGGHNVTPGHGTTMIHDSQKGCQSKWPRPLRPEEVLLEKSFLYQNGPAQQPAMGYSRRGEVGWR